MPAKLPLSAPYWTKNPDFKALAGNLSWNFPEQKSGSLALVGGNSQAFSTEVKLAEYLVHHYPFLGSVDNFFPNALKSKFPPLPNLRFFESTDSGSFKRSPEFRASLASTGYALFLGDLSKNSETALAIADVLKSSPATPAVLTRDTVDLIAGEADAFMNRENLTLIASLAQLQNLFRALYYPKMLLLSSPLLPVVETLHKFTLSYPVSLLTLHEDQIICAHGGRVASVPLSATEFSPLTLWSGVLAARFAVFSLFNPQKPLDSLLAALASV